MIIMDDGIQLNAQLDLPEDGRKKCPVVVIIHGFTGNMNEWHISETSRALNRIGFATLRADMYGHGSSDGEFRNHTLFKWMNNAMTLIDYARHLDFTDHIYLLGHSQGGLTAMLAAALKHDVVRGLVTLAPAWMIPEGARTGNLLGQKFDPDHLPEFLPAWNGQILDSNYIRVAQMIRVEEYIRCYQGPVLVVHGGDDGAVPVHFGREAARLYQNAELAEIPGDGHCFEHHLDMAIEAVTKWMSKYSG